MKTPQPLIDILNLITSDSNMTELAKQSGIAPSYICAIRKGKFMPSSKTISKIANTNLARQYGITKSNLMVATGYIEDHEIRDDYTISIGKYFIQFSPYKTKKGDMYLLYGWSSDLTIDSVWERVKGLERMGYDLEDAKVLGSTAHVRMIKD